MALKVWLPLNGSLENKGISDLKFSTINNTNTTISSEGKIGSCYSNNSFNAGGITSDKKITLPITHSMFCWFKFTNLNNISALGGGLVTVHNHLTNSGTGITIKYVSSTTGYLSLNTGNGSSRTYNAYTGTTLLQANTWYHGGFTYDGTNICLYLNGNLEKTQVYSNMAMTNELIKIFIWSTTNNGYNFNGSLNDVRIYDHCLSQKEIKEISQGLVLHYKLDGFSGGAGDNLLPNTSFNGISQKYTLNRGTEGGFMYTPISVNRSTLYTISCYLRGNANMTLYRICSGGNEATPWVNRNDMSETEYRYFSITFTSPAAKDISQIYICTRYGTSNSQVGDWFEIKPYSLKMEQGSTATSWSPAPKDLGIDTAKIKDSSGYENDGILTGILETSNDTSKYQLSSFFNGNDTAIQIPYNATIWQNNFTINLWFKKDELGSKNYETLIGGPSGFEMDTRAGSATTLSLYMASTRGGNVYSPFNFGEWYMVTLVNDGTNELYYINGNLVKTIEKKSMPAGNYFIGAWQTNIKQNYKGNISDFRIYATALSAEDIATLYHTPVQVDNLGGVHAFEFEEDADGRELLALPWTTGYTNHTKTSLWTKFNNKGEWTSNANSSSGTDYIKITPTGNTYYYDTEISVAAGNPFYIGFERYDTNKTSRSNNACVYIVAIKPTTDIVHQRYFGTVNLATDGTNPTDTITLRILNAWSGTTSDSTKEATIHYLSLREIAGDPQIGEIKQQGQMYTDELVEREEGQASIHENGLVSGNIIIEK